MFASADGDVAIHVEGEDASFWGRVGHLRYPLDILERLLKHSLDTLAAGGWDVEPWLYDCACHDLRRLRRR